MSICLSKINNFLKEEEEKYVFEVNFDNKKRNYIEERRTIIRTFQLSYDYDEEQNIYKSIICKSL